MQNSLKRKSVCHKEKQKTSKKKNNDCTTCLFLQLLKKAAALFVGKIMFMSTN